MRFYFKNIVYVGLTILTYTEQWANQDELMVSPTFYISTLKSRLNSLRKVFLFSKFYLSKLLTKYVYLVGNFICLYRICALLQLCLTVNYFRHN